MLRGGYFGHDGESGRRAAQDDAAQAEFERFQGTARGVGAVQQRQVGETGLGQQLPPPQAARIKCRTRGREQGDRPPQRQSALDVRETVHHNGR